MANEIELIVRGRDQATPALESVQEGLEGVGASGKKGSEGAKGMKQSLTELKSGVELAVGAFNMFKDAAEAAFDFAQEGAALNQLGDSFTSTGISINTLRAAARGTVDDATLMAGTLTLLAGSTGTARDAFAQAAPQLMEMAKAAQKLNPSLGDTTFLYESITIAAKRQSMEIADNLGIIVSTGEAYKKYAASIGVAVEALSDEQKQVAFLNGLLEAGNVLMEQAGGHTASAADGYAVLTAELKNMTDAAKQNVATGVQPLISSMGLLLTAFRETGTSTQGFNASMQFLKTLFTGTSPVIEEYEANLRSQASASERAKLHVGTTVQTLEEYIVASNEASIATSDYDLSLRLASKAALDASAAADRTVQAVMASTQAYSDLKMATQGELGGEIAKFAEQQENAKARVIELSSKISELEGKRYLTDAQREELAEMREALAESSQAVRDNVTEHEEATKRILFGYLQQRLGLDGLTDVELAALQEVANNWGLVDDATYSAIQAIDSAASAFESGSTPVEQYGQSLSDLEKTTLDFMIAAGNPAALDILESRWQSGKSSTLEYTQGVANLQRAIDELEGKELSITVKWDVEAVPQVVANAGGADIAMYAKGGLATSSGLSWVGEEGPELVYLPAGARVYPANESAKMMDGGYGIEGGGGGVTIQVNATINNGMDAEMWAQRIGEIAGQRSRSRALGVM